MIKFLGTLLLAASVAIAATDGTYETTTLKFKEASPGENRISVVPPALSADWTFTLPPDNGTVGQVLRTDGNGVTTWVSTGTGSVTSVDMTVPSFLAIAGNPITTLGTLAITLSNQSANTVFAGPSSGAAAAPTFRTLGTIDVPPLISLVPDQTGNAGKFLQTDGSLLSWSFAPAIAIYAGSNLVANPSPIVTIGTISLGTVAVSQGGTGLSSIIAANNILMNVGGVYAAGTIAAGTGASVTNSLGTITVASLMSLTGGSDVVLNPSTITGIGTISIGTLGIARGGTGRTTVATVGKFLLSDGTNYVDGTIAAGSGITVSNSLGTVSIAATGASSSTFNWTFNSDQEIWGAGTSAASTGWTLAGASATVAKNTTAGQFKISTSSAAITRAGADATYYQDIDLISGFGPAARWGSKTVVLGAWVRATVASRARIYIYDGTTTTYSSYHTGGSSLEFLTVTVALQATPTAVRVGLSVDTGDTTAQVDGFVFSLGSSVSDWIPSGWRGRKAVIVITSGSVDMVNLGDFYGNANGVSSANEHLIEATVPFKGVMRNAQMLTAIAPGATKTYVDIIRKNAADTTLTATVSGTNRTGSDLTNEVAFAAGDRYAGKYSAAANTPAQSKHTISVEYEEIP